MSAITITFGDCAENHVGMQMIGPGAARGLSGGDLARAKRRFEARGFACDLVNLISAAGVEDLGGEGGPEAAYVLVVRGGVGAFADPGAMRDEQARLPADRRFLDRRTGKVLNKIARHNLCFGEAAQAPDYESGKGRVVAFASVPATDAVRRGLPEFFGQAAADLVAEGNYYYDAGKCGIGWHGDGERRVVVACRLGAPIPLCYQWWFYGRPEGRRVDIALGHGDLYAMSEKAVGRDWRRPTVPTLRHAAGAAKYTQL